MICQDQRRVFNDCFRWNASVAFASYLDQHGNLYHDRCVLELGAGGALPSIVAAKNGAKRARNSVSSGTKFNSDGKFKVVITDYPDQPLIDNISHNVQQNIRSGPDRDRVALQVPYIIVPKSQSSPMGSRATSGDIQWRLCSSTYQRVTARTGFTS